MPWLRRALAPCRLDPAGCEGIDPNRRRQAQGQAARERHDRSLGRGEQLARVALHAGLGLIPTHGDDRTRALAVMRLPTARQRRIVAATSTDQRRSSLASKGSWAAAPVNVSAPAICSQASRPPQRAQASWTSRSPASRSARSAINTAARTPFALDLGRDRLGAAARATAHERSRRRRRRRAQGPRHGRFRTSSPGRPPEFLAVPRRIDCWSCLAPLRTVTILAWSSKHQTCGAIWNRITTEPSV